MRTLRRLALAIGLAGSGMTLAACDPGAVSTGGVVYYESMLWNDYHHNHPRPPGIRPPRPEPPIHRPAPRRR